MYIYTHIHLLIYVHLLTMYKSLHTHISCKHTYKHIHGIHVMCAASIRDMYVHKYKQKYVFLCVGV